MPAFGETTAPSFNQEVLGVWGSFNTPSGEITFLETKARLGEQGSDPESRLMKFLKPVREVLDTRDMDFNQLLQRDLDDHRVAVDLVPYIMRGGTTGPAFFPPVLAALLPFDGQVPQDSFPPQSEEIVEADPLFGHRRSYGHGAAFRFDRMVNSTGDQHNIKFGRLHWNDEQTQLVVLDGQHRTMALLAIFRTLNKSWSGQGERYKHFYEDVVKQERRRMTEEQFNDLKAVELPVTLLWFPNSGAGGTGHQLAARKLFVDVNKNARAPSPARLLLLDDSRLTAIFTREVLNQFRAADYQSLPIAAVEYDHPERDQASSAKWSAVTTASIVEGCILRTVFGPREYVENAAAKMKRGRENLSAGGSFMRKELQLGDEIEEIVEEYGQSIPRGEIRDDLFPRKHLAWITQRMMESWGGFILRMLSEVAPFAAHGQSIEALRKLWNPTDIGRLAKDAVMEGVGMYWTLRESERHWRETERLKLEKGLQKKPQKSDIVGAWDETELQKERFSEIRAQHFFGSQKSDDVQRSEECFNVFSTYACQVGLALAGRSVAYKGGVKHDDVANYAADFVGAVNDGLEGGAGRFGRRDFVYKRGRSPVYLIEKLDSSVAFQFRSLWLELLNTEEARPKILKHISEEDLDTLVSDGRQSYASLIVHEHLRRLKKDHPEWSADQQETRAKERALEKLKAGLEHWFGVSGDKFEQWREKTITSPQPEAESEEEPEEEEDSEE